MNPILAYFDLNNRPDKELVPVIVEKESARKEIVEQPVPRIGENRPIRSTERDISAQLFLAPPPPTSPGKSGKGNRNGRKRGNSKNIEPVHIPLWQHFIFYLGTVVGVLFSNAVTQFRSGAAVSITITLPVVCVAAVIGIIIMPYIHKHSIKYNSPFLFQ